MIQRIGFFIFSNPIVGGLFFDPKNQKFDSVFFSPKVEPSLFGPKLSLFTTIKLEKEQKLIPSIIGLTDLVLRRVDGLLMIYKKKQNV